MAYYNLEETKRRVEKVRGILKEKNLDCAIIYYDELNVADGWYLTGWCPQFEKEAVMVFANEADPILLGGPESAPFAKYASAITENYCFTPFMVPEEEYPNATIIGFDDLNKILQLSLIHI